MIYFTKALINKKNFTNLFFFDK